MLASLVFDACAGCNNVLDLLSDLLSQKMNLFDSFFDYWVTTMQIGEMTHKHG